MKPSDHTLFSRLKSLPYSFIRLSWLTMAIVCYSTLAYTAQNEGSEPLSLRFQDAPIRVILQALAEHRRLNLVVSDAVDGNLTIRLEDVAWQQALEAILNLADLNADIKNGVMTVMPAQEKRLRQQQRLEERERQEQKRSLSLLKFAVQHGDAEDLAATLRQQKGQILSERALVSVEPRTNALFIQELPEKLTLIKTLLGELDTPQRQIQITAHIVTISHEGLRELGVNWAMDGDQSPGINNITTQFPRHGSAVRAGFNLAKINGRLLSLELSALEQENKVDIIASPRLLTANNRIAAIKQGTELPYEVSSGSNGATSIEFKSAVLGLEVTPKILANDKINLLLSIAQNTPGRTIKQSNGGEVLAIDTQEINTQVTIANNETLVLGGVFQHRRAESVEKVPLLGAIPWLGRLFSYRSHGQTKRELIIFITPTLLNA